MNAVRFSPDGSSLATAGDGGDLIIWTVSNYLRQAYIPVMVKILYPRDQASVETSINSVVLITPLSSNNNNELFWKTSVILLLPSLSHPCLVSLEKWMD